MLVDGNDVFQALLRWVHILAGVTWIGLLYFFNCINAHVQNALEASARSQLVPQLMPRTLWWFRWGAMFTFLTGWIIVLARLHLGGISGQEHYLTLILTGGVMGTLMWANVWFVIWPAQKIVIASAEQVASGGEAIPEAAARGQRAGLASRTNTLFSIPMLFFMAAASHYPSLTAALDTSGGMLTVYWIIALIVIGIGEAGALMGPGLPTQKPLATVSGTIHGGLGIVIVLFAAQFILL